jgi:hypothetical protein
MLELTEYQHKIQDLLTELAAYGSNELAICFEPSHSNYRSIHAAYL